MCGHVLCLHTRAPLLKNIGQLPPMCRGGERITSNFEMPRNTTVGIGAHEEKMGRDQLGNNNKEDLTVKVPVKREN
jgi:hypothetical protein